MQFFEAKVVIPSGQVLNLISPSIHFNGFSGQGANSQSGGILPTALPSGQIFASAVQATGPSG